ncbi:choice-of-anchor H family protein [Shewanella colwelliana]|uniref:choice-of-anchor H family protein n=1 Tax=Shewanella colwelliana TaxID=23 RepID=UPI0022AEC64A|nr:choice-of-anchor H family protein [Shewanella colwelliana]MCZ4336852.1 choice-of-anchor H family protein [Shewanella colwelliana]
MKSIIKAKQPKVTYLNGVLTKLPLLLALGVSLSASADEAVIGSMASASSVAIEQQSGAAPQYFSRSTQEMNAQQLKGAQALKQMAVTPVERLTRDQVIAQRQQKSDKSTALRSSAERLAAGVYYEFAIYEASSRLFEDVDYDGFYRTFSVTFDADLYTSYFNQAVDVYADLYLSRNGGPWELFHTTDTFTIVDDASDDDFEVLTTLHSGYPTDHYDVLIDLYEVGYSDIVATISSDDVDDLYALPLESADRDPYEEVTTEVIVGGSLSTLGLFFLSGLAGLRRRFG